ncbi:MAG: trypsin-like peptidase domain-containing protein [Myxococcales bacterium]|nr:trypsin-like peptidase domain-containing protein [Myxococcales bacterium]
MNIRFFLLSRVVPMALAALPSVGCSSEAQNDALEDLSSPLMGAPEDTSHAFAVGVCQGALNTDPAKGPVGTCRSGTAKCSGTLIAPNLVLTARHCVAGADYGPNAATNPCDATFNTNVLAPGGTRITTSPSVYVGTPKWYDVAEVLVPSAASYCAADVALLVLQSNVPHREARPAEVDVARDLARRPVSEVAIVGRGGIDQTFELDANGDWTGNTTVDRGDLLRRLAEHVPFLCASNGPSLCTVVDHEVPTTHVYQLPVEQFLVGGPAGVSGDSNAKMFDQRTFTKPHRPTVLGVASWNFIGPDGKPSPNSGVQRLDVHQAFLREGAEKAAKSGHYELPEWAEHCGRGDRRVFGGHR